MKFLAGLVVLIAIIGAIVLPQIFYIVDETQLAIVTRFGEPRVSITSPGLYVKTPFVETVRYFEKRILIFDAAAGLVADRGQEASCYRCVCEGAHR